MGSEYMTLASSAPDTVKDEAATYSISELGVCSGGSWKNRHAIKYCFKVARSKEGHICHFSLAPLGRLSLRKSAKLNQPKDLCELLSLADRCRKLKIQWQDKRLMRISDWLADGVLMESAVV